MRFTTLKRSAEFRRVRGGARWASPLFIMEGRKRPDPLTKMHPGTRPEGEEDASRSSETLYSANGGADRSATPRRPPPACCTPPGGPRFGFTITRKVGGAVVRNRIRRRLKEALRLIEEGAADPSFDYVVVASRAVHDYPFDQLQADLRTALARMTDPPPKGTGRKRRRKGSPGREA